jgi:predicted amidohydrolase YtcJ
MFSKLRTLCVGTALIALLAGCGEVKTENPADTIYVNGKIFTGSAAQPWAEAIATKGSNIQAVGTTADIQKLKGEKSTVVDLGGRTVLPGFIDSHTHTLFGSMALHGVNFSTTESSVWADEKPDEFVATLQKYAAENPNEKIIFARANFVPLNGPTHELLDRAVPDKPLVIHNVNEHSMWVNRKALELAGITNEPVADPIEEAGVVRASDGSPTGYFREAAMELIERPVLATLSEEEKLTILRKGIKFLNQNGITTVINATGDLQEIQLYGKLRDNNELTLRTRTSFGAVAAPHKLTPAFLDDIEAARKNFNDDWVSANLIKFFTDGASGPWPPIYKTDEMANIMIELDKRGFQLMTHALQADSAVQVLAAYQIVEKANGQRDRRWRIEHGSRIEKKDMPEFARMGIITSSQPAFCCGVTKPGTEPSNPWQSLLKSGVGVIFSSDWPCSWPAAPLFGIQQAVTRDIWTGRGYGAGMAGRTRTGEQDSPEEAVTVEQAVKAYTADSAYAAFWDTKIGSLEAGKLADFVVLTQDIFTVPSGQIGDTKIASTVVGGKVVYQAQ